MSDTAFIFVPDAFHTLTHFKPIIAALAKRNLASHAVSYPTTGATASALGLQDELRAIRASVRHVVESEHKDVVLVAHGYGGFPASRAVTGWDRQTREREGKSGGIKHIFFVAAVTLPERMGIHDLLAGVVPLWVDDGVCVVS